MEMEGRRGSNKEENKSSVVVSYEETTMDWRGRVSNSNKHGGMRAATFILGTSLSFALSHISSYIFVYLYIKKHKRYVHSLA